MRKDDKCPICGGPMDPDPVADAWDRDTGERITDFYAPACAFAEIDGMRVPVLLPGQEWPCFVALKRKRTEHERN